MKLLDKILGRNGDINVNIKNEAPAMWTQGDSIKLKTFLDSESGKKFIHSLEYTIYEYTINGRVDRQFISGLCMALGLLKNGSIVTEEEEDDNEIDFHH